MRRILAVVATITAVLLAGGSCDGGDTEPAHLSWPAWAKAHPVPGARVDHAGLSSGGWSVDARLTATPTRRTVAAAFDDLCRFAKQAEHNPSLLTLSVGADRLGFVGRCGHDEAQVPIWSALHGQPHVRSIDLVVGPWVTLDRGSGDTVLAVFRTVARHGQDPGRITVVGPRLRLTADADEDPSTSLRRADRARAVIGPRLRGLEVDADTVTASVAGPRADLPALRKRLPGVEVDSTLTVLPDRANRSQVGLLEDLSLRQDVTQIDYDGSLLTVTVTLPGAAVSVADRLADPRLRDLRPLAIALPGSFAHAECTVTLRFPDDGHLSVAMRRCLQARSR